MKFIAIAAITIDGRIAKGQKHMSDWTSKEDKVFMRGLLDKCDLVIVGNNTYQTALKPLSKRNCLVFSRTENKRKNELKNLDYIDPSKTDVKKYVKNKGCKQIAVLGGAQTYAYCLKNNLLDELYLTIEPLVFGSGVSLFGEAVFNSKFKLKSIKKLNNTGTIVLKYITA